MSDKLNQTQKILRSSRVTMDERGRTVWVDPVETANLELMSTQMLKKVIDSNDAKAKKDLRRIAKGESGLVARDMNSGKFEVINDEELQRILDGTDGESDVEGSQFVEEATASTFDNSGELELVSTQMLCIALNLKDDETPAEESADEGFDPYNSR